MRGLGSMMVGGSAGKRQAHDFYPTPPEVTAALLGQWRPRARVVDEPACGDGAIARVLARHGYRVVASDLVDRGYGEAGVDFLEVKRLRAPAIVTNPPFEFAAEFIDHGLTLGAVEMAQLLKSTFWHTAEHFKLFHRWMPAVVFPLTWRVDFLGLGGPTMDLAWSVWKRGHRGYPPYVPLARPRRR